MASTSTIKTNCYNFLNSNLRNIIDNKFERNESASFDEFAETRGRSTRAASLALPNNSLLDLFDKEQTLLNPVNLKPTLTTSIKNTISSTVHSLNKLRRHSTSASCEQDDESGGVAMAATPNGVFSFTGNSSNGTGDSGSDGQSHGVLPLSNENLKRHQRMSTRRSRSNKSPISSTSSANYLPPVPRRPTTTGQQRSTAVHPRQKSYSVDQRDSPATTSAVNGNGKLFGKFSSLNSISGRNDDDLDDDRMSVESSVFEDTPPYSAQHQMSSCDYLLHSYDENSSAILTKKMLSASNRSSSDSNKSQITIDTGYMSSTTSTASAVTNNTTESVSAAERTGSNVANGTFRSRFSSEDTQSSLDSFMSSEPQQRFQAAAEYGASYGQTNPSPSYLQTGGTSSHYLATAAGSNDVIEYLQKYSARNYPNNLRTATTTNTTAKAANTGVGRRSQQQHLQQPQVQQQHNFSGTSSSSASASTTADPGPMIRGGTTGAVKTTITSSVVLVGTKDDALSVNSTSATNSMTSISSSTTTATAAALGLNGSKQPVGLLQLTPPTTTSTPSSTSSLSASSSVSSSASSSTAAAAAQRQPTSTSSSVSLSSTGVTSITTTTTISTTSQPRNSRGGSGGTGGSVSGLASLAMPLRSQVSFDSAKIIQTGQILGAKITQHFTSKTQQQQTSIDSQKERTPGAGSGVIVVPPQSASNPPRRGLNGILNKPPPLTQIHHTKMNQRQDSNISSDSFSITSSPGYNSKGMEAPLLQHTSKIHRSIGAMKHQDSSDSFNMTVRGYSGGGGGGGSGSRKFNVRQDSTISSDSFSQTSSPGYNSKFMEAPLLAHAAKMHKSEWEERKRKKEKRGIDPATFFPCSTVKQGFNERLPRSPLTTEHHPTSPIIKSASTPASLQTIVRFQNGSNMSLQHKVSVDE